LNSIADVSFVRRVVFLRVGRVLANLHFAAQRVDARIPCDSVLIVSSREPPEDQWHGNHVLNAVVPVGGIGERASLVDDANARLLSLDHNLVDLIDAVFDLRM